MTSFPAFMKSPQNRIAASSQHTEDIEGFVFDGAEGSQVAFWECSKDRVSKEHVHDFDDLPSAFTTQIRVLALAGAGALWVAASSCGQSSTRPVVCAITTEHTASSCAANGALCAGGTDRFAHEESTIPEGAHGISFVACSCSENGVRINGSFGVTRAAIADSCNVSADAFRMQAADACGWTLDQD